MRLADRDPIPTQAISDPLRANDAEDLLRELGAEWRMVDSHHLEKRFAFDDFDTALNFVNRIGRLADEMDHHPDTCFGWGYCTVSIWTHKVGGLSVNDFIFAARVEDMDR